MFSNNEKNLDQSYRSFVFRGKVRGSFIHLKLKIVQICMPIIGKFSTVLHCYQQMVMYFLPDYFGIILYFVLGLVDIISFVPAVFLPHFG